MRYAVARIKESDRDTAYRIYVTDALKSAYNINIRYADVISGNIKVSEDDPETIKNRLKKKLGGIG